ncbi:MAG: hypothetical protein WC205_18405 [Opitutaceae bacterium]|jgi:hypothetical protein
MKDATDAIKGLIEWADSRRIAIVVILFCSLISPGCLGLFYYQRELFERLDTLKIIILSASISVPFILTGALTAFVSFDIKVGDEKMVRKAWLYGAAQSGVILHGCLLYAFTGAIHSLRDFLVSAIVVHAAVFFLFFILGRLQTWRDSRRKNKKATPA